MNKCEDPADAIIHHWMEITRLLRQKMSHNRKASEMNPMQMHALLIIKERKGLTMKEFAECLHVTSPSATSFVNRLVKMKWVRRSADAHNRKLVRLGLSGTGLKVVTRKMVQHTHMMHDLFSLLSKADQRQFARILGNLQNTLAQHSRAS